MSDLNLFKYDPAVDGEQTFNIDKALNENWDKITAYAEEVDKNVGWLQRDISNLDYTVTGLKEQVNNVDVSWPGISGKPSTFPPSSHTHNYLPLGGGTVSGYLGVGDNMDVNGSLGVGGQLYLNVNGSAVAVNSMLSDLKAASQGGYITPSNNFKYTSPTITLTGGFSSSPKVKAGMFYLNRDGAIRVDTTVKTTAVTGTSGTFYTYYNIVNLNSGMLQSGDIGYSKNMSVSAIDYVGLANGTTMSTEPSSMYFDMHNIVNNSQSLPKAGTTTEATRYIYLRSGLYMIYCFNSVSGNTVSTHTSQCSFKIGYSEVNV